MHLDIDGLSGTKSEVQTGVVERHIAGLAHHRLGLQFSPVMNQHARSDGAAVAFGAFEADLDPVIFLVGCHCGAG